MHVRSKYVFIYGSMLLRYHLPRLFNVEPYARLMNHRTYREVVVFDCIELYWNLPRRNDEYYEVPQSVQPVIISSLEH
jgi:hypothetical protein